MEFPYYAFDISTDDGELKLSVTAIDKGMPETLKMGGLTVDFNIQVTVCGINADFKCWISVGNLYIFYTTLQKCYNNLCGVAILKDYSEKLTNISVDFHKTGKCTIYGYAQNGVYSGNKIEFRLNCDQTYIDANIKTLKKLFDELALIQGFDKFPY